MKHLLTNIRVTLALSALVFVAGIAAPRANADEWNKRTILTVNDTIQVEDAVLPPGQYVMKLMNSDSNRHIVQIFNHNERHIIATVLAFPKERLTPTGETVFTFWETPAGAPRAMRDWYYPGDLIGQEFPYHPVQVQQPVQQQAKVVQPPPPPPPQPQPEVQEEQPQPEETPAPPVEEAPAPAPEQPAPAPPPALPKTASPYPLVGLSGLALLSLGGLLLLRRQSAR